MKKELIAYTDPKSPIAEVFKTLRTNIQFMNVDKELKTLLVTSTLPEEGKSWVSANLAVTFAQTGKKVLLIDADMRKGRQFNMFDVSPMPGLSNYLSGVVDGFNNSEHNIEEFVQQTEIDNLYILTSGSVPPNPSELLVSEKMLNLLKWIKGVFDVAIFDGPPALLVTDAPILSRIVDSTIIVTAHNQTKTDDVEKVKKSIENIGGKIAGIVINRIPISAKKYENTYYYGETPTKSTRNKKTKNENTFRGINSFDNLETKNLKKQETKGIDVEPEIEENIYTSFKSTEYDKKDVDSMNSFSGEIVVDKTQDILKQIKNYLDTEKNNLKNGDEYD